MYGKVSIVKQRAYNFQNFPLFTVEGSVISLILLF